MTYSAKLSCMQKRLRARAILVTLNPGGYTAIVRGANGSTGIGIFEVFAR